MREARDGTSGLALAAERVPDVALIDIGLPDLDGYEVARRLRASPGGRRMGLVAITGYGQPEDQKRAFEAGFDAHLTKPVAPERLKQVHGGPAMNQRLLVVDDDADMRLTLKLSLELAGYAVDVAANGREALEVQRMRPADVLITDIFMPDADGFEAIDALPPRVPAHQDHRGLGRRPVHQARLPARRRADRRRRHAAEALRDGNAARDPEVLP